MTVLFQTHFPSAPLSRYVEMLWFFSGAGLPHRRERVMPDGSAELVINLDDVPRKRFDRRQPHRFQTVRRSWVSGAQPEFILIDVPPRATMIGVHFKPGGLAAFMPMPASELSGQLIEADALWGRDAEALRHALLEAPHLRTRFRILEHFLQRRVRPASGAPSPISAALGLLEAEPSVPMIAAVAGRVGLSHKHFIHRFRSEIGLSPKRFCRIRRFQRALRDLQTRSSVDWTDLACASGYYDQAHLIHDFRSFSGLTPTRYLGQPGADNRFVPIAD